MTRNLKTLGIALAAVLVLGAAAASAASAQHGFLTSTGNMTLNATETGVEANRITAFGAFVECPGSTYAGHQWASMLHVFIPSGAWLATLTPSYKEKTAGGPNCKGSLNTSATIDMNECDYGVHLGETTGGVAGTYGVTFDIVCPFGKEIAATVWLTEAAHTSEPTKPKCILRFPPQIGLNGLHATDTGNGTIDLTGAVTGIKATQTRNSILCPAGTETPSAEFDLDVNVTGKNESGGATSISLSHN